MSDDDFACSKLIVSISVAVVVGKTFKMIPCSILCYARKAAKFLWRRKKCYCASNINIIIVTICHSGTYKYILYNTYICEIVVVKPLLLL